MGATAQDRFRFGMRSRIIRAAAGSGSNTDVGTQLDWTEPWPGRVRMIEDARIKDLITHHAGTTTKNGTHWSARGRWPTN